MDIEPQLARARALLAQDKRSEAAYILQELYRERKEDFDIWLLAGEIATTPEAAVACYRRAFEFSRIPAESDLAMSRLQSAHAAWDAAQKSPPPAQPEVHPFEAPLPVDIPDLAAPPPDVWELSRKRRRSPLSYFFRFGLYGSILLGMAVGALLTLLLGSNSTLAAPLHLLGQIANMPSYFIPVGMALVGLLLFALDPLV